jgi:putative hydrolase of the HAD superfamily
MIAKRHASAAMLVADADNTLWDTDAVYANAQLALLTAVEKAMGIRASSDDRLSFIREIDQQLAIEHHQHLRYPPRLLVAALASTLAGASPMQAARGTVRASLPSPKEINPDKVAEQFIEQIRTGIPGLRIGVSIGLQKLHAAGVPVVVATEGAEDKCKTLLQHHGLIHLIEKIVSAPKTVEFFRRIARLMRAGEGLCFNVGDQLDRDIAPAKQAGYRTIYFPGGFKPAWTPEEKQVAPDFRISSFDEIVPIIEQHVGRKKNINDLDRAKTWSER